MMIGSIKQIVQIHTNIRFGINLFMILLSLCNRFLKKLRFVTIGVST